MAFFFFFKPKEVPEGDNKVDRSKKIFYSAILTRYTGDDLYTAMCARLPRGGAVQKQIFPAGSATLSLVFKQELLNAHRYPVI